MAWPWQHSIAFQFQAIWIESMEWIEMFWINDKDSLSISQQSSDQIMLFFFIVILNSRFCNVNIICECYITIMKECSSLWWLYVALACKSNATQQTETNLWKHCKVNTASTHGCLCRTRAGVQNERHVKIVISADIVNTTCIIAIIVSHYDTGQCQ